jgi:hypothetical protein
MLCVLSLLSVIFVICVCVDEMIYSVLRSAVSKRVSCAGGGGVAVKFACSRQYGGSVHGIDVNSQYHTCAPRLSSLV